MLKSTTLQCETGLDQITPATRRIDHPSPD
jgi:hypothetical protein